MLVLSPINADQTKRSEASMKAGFPKPRISGWSPPLVMNQQLWSSEHLRALTVGLILGSSWNSDSLTASSTLSSDRTFPHGLFMSPPWSSLLFQPSPNLRAWPRTVL